MVDTQMGDSLRSIEQRMQDLLSEIYKSIDDKFEAKLDTKLTENSACFSLL